VLDCGFIDAMNLIPVIDLMQGVVVRACRGERGSYRPIDSALCRSSDPLAVAAILRDHCAARQMYIADLDALTGGAPQHAVVRSLARALAGVELWVDAGFVDAAAVRDWQGRADVDAASWVPVLASESLSDVAAVASATMRDGSPRHDVVLSLDRRGSELLDRAGCWTRPTLWPTRVIVMTLERVGADQGPDLDTFAKVRGQAPGRQFIGAGGIRDARDLVTAREAGASAWLVASALHDRRLPAADGC
jgi:phosphoribosylformimino-5-aminoimidazole carboxamide ribotide isomerase